MLSLGPSYRPQHIARVGGIIESRLIYFLSGRHDLLTKDDNSLSESNSLRT